MLTYITPLIMANNGFSNTAIGLLIGSSSVAGVFFDFAVSLIFKRSNYRKFFMIMLAICVAYPLVLGGAREIWGYLLAMILWGIYFDLYGFGVFGFVSHFVKRNQHASAFGEILAFKSIGTSIAPLIVGLLLVGVFVNVFLVASFFIALAIVCFLVLVAVTWNHEPLVKPERAGMRSIFREIELWKKTSIRLWVPLSMTFFLFLVDSFFWTLAPLYALSLNFSINGGIFLAAYCIPFLISGLVAGWVTKRFRNVRTAFISLFIGSLSLSIFMFVAQSYAILLIVLVAAFFFGLSLAAINAAYADFISAAPQIENEIVSIEDSSFNLGYIVGPVAGGLLSDIFSIPVAFSILGAIGLFIVLFVTLFSRKRATIFDA